MKETKAFLNQIMKINKLIEHKQEEIQQLRSMAMSTAINLGERVQSSGSNQRMADTIDRYIDELKCLEDDIGRLLTIKKEVLHVIEQLPLEQYDLLYNVYVHGAKLKDYAVIADKSYNWVKSVHGTALLNVRQILKENKTNYLEVANE